MRRFNLQAALAIVFTLGLNQLATAQDNVYGEVQYRVRVEFTVETVATFNIYEVDKDGARGKTAIAATKLVEALPFPFVIRLDPKKTRAGAAYKVGVSLSQDNKVIFASQQDPPAAVDGKPNTDFVIEVESK